VDTCVTVREDIVVALVVCVVKEGIMVKSIERKVIVNCGWMRALR
jgi:hypothetical protein